MGFYIVQFLTGLSDASSLFLIASGLSLIFGVTRIVNFAHGSFYMVGAYVAYSFISFLPQNFYFFWIGVLGAALVVGVLGVFVEISLLRRLYHVPELFLLMATFGIVLILQDGTRWIFGAEDLLGPRAPGIDGSVMVNPYKGYFANINFRINQTWLGSDQNSSTLWTEFRTYVGLSKKKPRHLVAFWVFGDFQVTGKRPYLTLMALAEDQRSRSGRGYVGGRFRGEDYIYGEVEYRFPISQCSQLVGGVIFINANTVSNRESNVHLFEYIRPAVGFGFRFMINKHARLNVNLDFGFGFESKGFYFSGTETF